MASRSGFSIAEKKLILEKLKLTSLKSVYAVENFVDNVPLINLDSDTNFSHQLTDRAISKLSQETNNELQHSSEMLYNTLSCFDSAVQSFILSYNHYLEMMEKVNTAQNISSIKAIKKVETLDTLEENDLETSDKVTVTALYETCKSLLEENIELKNKMNDLRETLSRYKVLPCDPNQIETKLLQLLKTLGLHQDKTY